MGAKPFSEQVKAVRTALNLSQEELAHALGVSFATVNRLENGKPARQNWLSVSLNSFARIIERRES